MGKESTNPRTQQISYQGKYLSLFLSNTLLLIIIIFTSFSVLGQMPIEQSRQLEYAKTLCALSDFENSSKLFNKYHKYHNFYKSEYILAIIANYKSGNQKFVDYWTKSYSNIFAFSDLEFKYLDAFQSLNEVDKKNIKKIISKQNQKSKSSSKIDLNLMSEISGLIAIDQFIRINYSISDSIALDIDRTYVFEELMDLLLKDFSLENIAERNIDLKVIILHQADYKRNFDKIMELNLLQKLLKKRILTPGFYADIMDRYYDSQGKKIKYGTLYSSGKLKNLDDYNLDNINKNRRKIGLCELQYTYDNDSSLLSKEIIHKEILEKVKDEIQ